MKKIGILLLLCALLVLVGCNSFGSGGNVAVVDDGCYYGMSVGKLTYIKGEPLEVIQDYCDMPVIAYTYNETIQGLKADTVYLFDDGVFSTSLTEVHYTFSNVEYDVALPVAKEIYRNVSNEYNEKDGFYETNFSEENGSFSANLGTTNGATGISVSIDYIDNTLNVSCVNQQ